MDAWDKDTPFSQSSVLRTGAMFICALIALLLIVIDNSILGYVAAILGIILVFVAVLGFTAHSNSHSTGYERLNSVGLGLLGIAFILQVFNVARQPLAITAAILVMPLAISGWAYGSVADKTRFMPRRQAL